MALPLPPGLVPSEVAFLCEMELVTVVPRQKLDTIDLLSVSVPCLTGHHHLTTPSIKPVQLKLTLAD